MLTIFSSPRPFIGEFDYLQRNAISSWISACPGCEIILLGDDEGTERVASELKVKHIPKVKRSEKGVILRNSVFLEAQKQAKNKLMCYVNADIILTKDLLKAIEKVKLSSFLLSSRRWDIDIKGLIDFNDKDWEEKLRRLIKGGPHSPAAGDYFVFFRNVEIKMPPFSIKHGGWDNWFIYRFKKLGIPVIDATEVITVLHQNHGRPHLKNVKSIWKGKEAKKELELAGGFSNMCTFREADLLLTTEGLKKPPFFRMILSKIALFYPWRLILSLKRSMFS